MINIENFEKLDQPYPIAIVDDFFNDNDLNKITNEFPSYDDFTKFKKTMVNRHILSNENPEFYKFIEINKSWVKFYEIINSHNFFLRILKILTGNNSYEYKKFLELNFNKEFNQKKKIRFNLFFYFRELIQKIPRNIFTNFLRNLTKKILYKKNDGRNSFYLRFDISSASNGYKRTPHTDSDGTLIAFLIYLEDKNKIGGSGGNFIINDKNLNKVREIEPKKNRAVFFLSNKNSFHSVSEMKNAIGWRKFVYGGFTSVDKLIWSKIK
tara:strand:+ start:1145 stop:1945 length:801 start_codon:yes stop_codon:yes gene_type:complete